ncbi:hypothetical protein [Peribacillus muralis]|uniref:hypothetical protein n=1 Tax=Peribacillus muralis TaxID=264697 RepID=UPI003D0028BD
MKDEHETKNTAIDNPDLHKALRDLSERFNLTMTDLFETVRILIQNQAGIKLYDEDAEKDSPVEELKSALIKNEEIIKKKPANT